MQQDRRNAVDPFGRPGQRRQRWPSLKFQLRGILKHNRDGSYATQRKREQCLLRFFEQIKEDGYRLRLLANLKPKHILSRVESWEAAGLSAATMRTEMGFVRWLCEKLGKAEMVPSNEALGIAPRTYSFENKAWDDVEGAALLSRVAERSPVLHDQMRLMRLFGLRFEEAAILRPHENDHGDTLRVVYGTKGGRPRVVPIGSAEQRRFLDELRQRVPPGHSMTPAQLSFVQWRDQAKHIATVVGLAKKERTHFHALRHRYAQSRYLDLTGFEAPCTWAQNGHRPVTAEMLRLDQAARRVIAEELGHSRTEVTKNYLGLPLQ